MVAIAGGLAGDRGLRPHLPLGAAIPGPLKFAAGAQYGVSMNSTNAPGHDGQGHGPGPDATPDTWNTEKPESSPGPAHSEPEESETEPTENPGPQTHPDEHDFSHPEGNPGPSS